MEGDGFLTDILLNGGDGDVAGLDDLNFPITQDTRVFMTFLLKFKKFMWKCSQVAVQRDRRGQKNSLQGRRSCMLRLVER